MTRHLDEVAARLRAGLPGVVIERLEVLGEGEFCRAYLLNGRRVVRVPKHEEAGRALAREACLLPRIADMLPVGVPLPRTVAGRTPATLAFSIHDAVTGGGLSQELWRGLPAATRDRLAREVGAALRALHAVDPVAGRACGLEGVDYGARMRELRRRLYAPEGRVLSAALRDSLAAAFDRYLIETAEWRYEPAVLHADVSPEHVLVDEELGELTGLIDWSDVCIGDPARDFIYLYEDWGPDFLELALEGYAPKNVRRFVPRIYLHYLAEQLEWLLDAGTRAESGVVEAATAAELKAGEEALDRALRDLRVSLDQELRERLD